MGTDETSGQADPANNEVTAVQRVLKILGLPEADPVCLEGLRDAMARFASNRTLWFDQHEVPEFRRLLQSHGCFTLLAPAGRADRARLGVNALREAGLASTRTKWALPHIRELIGPLYPLP